MKTTALSTNKIWVSRTEGNECATHPCSRLAIWSYINPSHVSWPKLSGRIAVAHPHTDKWSTALLPQQMIWLARVLKADVPLIPLMMTPSNGLDVMATRQWACKQEAVSKPDSAIHQNLADSGYLRQILLSLWTKVYMCWTGQLKMKLLSSQVDSGLLFSRHFLPEVFVSMIYYMCPVRVWKYRPSG